MQNGFQLCVHAIGDRANRETLDIFERAFKANPAKKDLRWRVEHAQHISAQDIPRFGKMGVIASMQGIHCTSDAPYVLERLGAARAQEGAYVWQKLMKTGAIVANGTDAPVEDVDPIPNYYASVSRKLKDGKVFFADQRMSRMEALKSYTINGAYAAFEEGQPRLAEAGQVRRHHRAVERHPEDSRGRDPHREGDLHHRRREGPLQAIVTAHGRHKGQKITKTTRPCDLRDLVSFVTSRDAGGLPVPTGRPRCCGADDCGGTLRRY